MEDELIDGLKPIIKDHTIGNEDVVKYMEVLIEKIWEKQKPKIKEAFEKHKEEIILNGVGKLLEEYGVSTPKIESIILNKNQFIVSLKNKLD